MRRPIFTLFLMAVLLVAFMSTLSVQAHQRCAAMPRIHHEMMANELKLSEEQKSKMADLRLALQKELLPLRTELQSKMTEIHLLKTDVGRASTKRNPVQYDTE